MRTDFSRVPISLEEALTLGGLQANITRRAKDQAERLHVEEIWAEVRRRPAAQAQRPGDFAGVHVCPEDNGDIPDTDEARLVILHAKVTHKKGAQDSSAMTFARTATDHRGTALSYMCASVHRGGVASGRRQV